MSYSQITSHYAATPKSNTDIVLDSLDELNSNILSSVSTNPPAKITESSKLIQMIFGDYICEVSSSMCRYWNQFGFFDKYLDETVIVSSILDVIKKNASIKENTEEDEDDSDDENNNI